MIIDADTHITPTGEGIFIEELISRMERAGIDKALTWLQPPYMREINELNSYIYKATKIYPDRILGFGWADPNLGVEKAIDMVKRCVYDYGFYGVKMNGAQNNYFIDDPKKALPVIEEIAKTGKILAFHVGADAYEHTHPFRVGKIAKIYPQMNILMVHMGGAGMPNLSRAAVEVAREYKNITLIGSAVSSKDILRAIKELGAKRVCFGSDTPFQPMHVELAKYNALLDGEVNDEEKHDIMAGNIARLFGIDV